MTIKKMYINPKWLVGATIFLICAAFKHQVSVYRCENGLVSIKSEATLELIQAKSKQLRGIIDPVKQTFLWTVSMKSFEGFNSPLQREHFNETYVESHKYTQAMFSGKIIEDIDFEKDGKYQVRAKGKLTIHGVEQERIIKSTLEIRGKKIVISSSFTVPISDHDIKVPKLVHQKIAAEINVNIDAQLDR